jgi:hypothetical protein
MKGRTFSLIIAGLCLGTNATRADVVTDWNEKAVAFVTSKSMPPPAADRIMAMVHVAMYDAVNSIEHRYRPFLVAITPEMPVSPDAAAATAASTVLAGISADSSAELKAASAAYLAAIPDGGAKTEGIKLGEAVAARILEARAKDRANAPDAYRPKTKPGAYIPTPITASSMWPDVVPFAMSKPSQFRPPPPISLESAQWITDYTEIKTFGSNTSSQRSARQTEDARFWLMVGPPSYYPLARQLVMSRKMSLIDSVRFMALVSVAIADGYISVFDAKYTYEFWRPITAIRNGDLQKNPAIQRDATWQPYGTTPMHPEYPCAHCIAAGAFAGVVETLFGSADVPELALTSSTAPGVTHRWSNMWTYANEVDEARIWAGFHYRTSTLVGQDMGRKIGHYVVQTVMQPM